MQQPESRLAGDDEDEPAQSDVFSMLLSWESGVKDIALYRGAFGWHVVS